jgi:hypothetical protein
MAAEVSDPGGGSTTVVSESDTVPRAPYAVDDSYRTIETLGGVGTRDVQQVIARALPSNVSFPLRVTLTPALLANPAGVTEQVSEIASRRSGYVAFALSVPGVIGMYAIQEFTASNQQEDHWVLTISSTSGLTQTTRSITFRQIVPSKLVPIVDAVRSQLDAMEAGGG